MTKLWSNKYKKSINCRRPKGFSQKQYCKYGRNKTKKIIRKVFLQIKEGSKGVKEAKLL